MEQPMGRCEGREGKSREEKEETRRTESEGDKWREVNTEKNVFAASKVYQASTTRPRGLPDGAIYKMWKRHYLCEEEEEGKSSVLQDNVKKRHSAVSRTRCTASQGHRSAGEVFSLRTPAAFTAFLHFYVLEDGKTAPFSNKLEVQVAKKKL